MYAMGSVPCTCNDDLEDVTNTSQLVNPNYPEDRLQCKFGDILDTTGQRHYGYSIVGKDGAIINTKRTHEMVLDQELGTFHGTATTSQ